jgi:hypothetical protein
MKKLNDRLGLTNEYKALGVVTLTGFDMRGRFSGP